MSKHHCGKVSFISAVGGYLVREGVFDNSMAKFASWVSKDNDAVRHLLVGSCNLFSW